jgi:O-antigen/teichoic acid export membrane protein
MSQVSTDTPSLPRLRQLLAGMAGYGAADAFSGLVRLGLAALYSRLLAPEEFGVLAVIYVSVSFGTALLALGLPDALLIRFRAKHAGQIRAEKDRVYTLLSGLCAAATLVALAVLALFPSARPWQPIGAWACVWAATQVLWFVPQQSLRFHNKVWQYGASRLVQVGVQVVTLVALISVREAGLLEIVIAEAVGSLVSLVVIHVFDRYLPHWALPSRAMDLVVPALPFCLLALGSYVVDLSDRYVVTAMLGTAATGYYAAATRITVVGMLLAAAMHAMWQPYFYRQAAEAPDTRLVRGHAERLTILATVAIAAGMLLLPLFFTLQVAGHSFMAPAYRQSAVLVAPLMMQFYFRAVYYLMTPAIAFRGRTWRQVAMVALSGAANVFGNVVVISLGGELFVNLVLVALVSAACYAGAMSYGLREMHTLYPGAAPSWKLILAETTVLGVVCAISVS